ncbi:MAG TPA: D-glycero-beta-D-manno-heptose 1-phosphate adenylyltransferase [bacterium]|nr:D-glycero-beta-D-manno-heptose 1-phosphate adenylyltransferase [bacterium]HEX68636.1 D-glycero-beta-D-manno-heptose 1-phosphate adenylyltransferase [bacterium]
MGKILTRSQAKEIIRKEREKGKKIVFTNGCFDLLHAGHIYLLREAKKEGDILIVALNSDSSVRKIKGISRPIYPEKERAEILASLEMVDYVVIFEETTPYQIIKELKPHILVKGGDWRINEVVGRDLVESWGGKVKIVPYLSGFSTTNIVEKIKKTDG